MGCSFGDCGTQKQEDRAGAHRETSEGRIKELRFLVRQSPKVPEKKTSHHA